MKTLSDFRRLEQDVWTYEEEAIKEAIQELLKQARWTKSGFVGGMITIELRDIIKEVFGEELTKEEKE